MKTETIEQKTYRLLQIANKNDVGVAIDSDFVGKMFKGLLDNSIFKLHCKMIELAIAEERQRFERICRDHHAKWHDGDVPEPHGPLDCIADIHKQDEVSE